MDKNTGKEDRSVEWACKVLIEHNKWRRGQPPYDDIPCKESLKPKEIGEAIDIAVNELMNRTGKYVV